MLPVSGGRLQTHTKKVGHPTNPGLAQQRIPAMSATPDAVEAPPQLSAEVRFRRDGDRLCVAHAPTVMWFAQHVLDGSRADPDVGLSFDGTYVTLHASNGRWVWKLTGRSWTRRAGPGVDHLVMVEGAWPD